MVTQSQLFVYKSDPRPYFSVCFANHSNSPCKASNPVFASCFLPWQNHVSKTTADDLSCIAVASLSGINMGFLSSVYEPGGKKALIALWNLTAWPLSPSTSKLLVKQLLRLLLAHLAAGNLVQRCDPQVPPQPQLSPDLLRWISLLYANLLNWERKKIIHRNCNN